MVQIHARGGETVGITASAKTRQKQGQCQERSLSTRKSLARRKIGRTAQLPGVPQEFFVPLSQRGAFEGLAKDTTHWQSGSPRLLLKPS